jgi:hypothetical protein
VPLQRGVLARLPGTPLLNEASCESRRYTHHNCYHTPLHCLTQKSGVRLLARLDLSAALACACTSPVVNDRARTVQMLLISLA